MLRTLVSTSSISSLRQELDSSNRGVLDHLGNWLEELKFKVDISPVPNTNGKFNLVARKGRGEGGVLFAGHTDTVACDEDLWTYDPFDVNEAEDKYYGLGSCDMKGFFPIALAAASAYSERSLRAPISILATADEETTMAGARHLAEESSLTSKVAVIGEPTSMQPVYAHKGIFVLKIQTKGQSGHSSNPALGTNALEGMHEILGELLRVRDELKSENRHSGFEIQYPTLNLGCLHAGDSANRICGHADLLIDVRVVPGMSSEETQRQLSERVKKLESKLGMPVAVNESFPPIEPFETSPDDELVQLMERYSGRRAKTVAFGTEAPFLQKMGIETVVFGPGSIDQAHQADEYLGKNQIEPTRQVLEMLIDKYCLQDRKK